MPTRAEATIIGEERLRVNAILSSPEGLRCPTLAREFVLDGTDARRAISIMGKSSAESPFLERMAVEGPIGISSTLGNAAPGNDREARLAEIRGAARSYSQATYGKRGEG